MNIIDIINKKASGEELSQEEIQYVISEYMSGNILDYQMSSLLMAIKLKDMTSQEINYLTYYMLNSGDKLDLSSLGTVVDKHSTGGVGDKTTMIISPMVAACGVKVAKMSGRGLGHTGGTIDKLEAIPGFKTKMTKEEFIKQIAEIGLTVTSQTDNLAPADKKIYALRDVTGTVESIPLIASSIMSKKIASGAKKLVLDVKVGRGALIKNLDDAKKLASIMIEIGKYNDMGVVCLLTNMDVPLGECIGNSLEVEEAIEVLTLQKDGQLKDLCIELASYMVSLGLGIAYDDAKVMVMENLNNGNAYAKFKEFIAVQGGDLARLPKSDYRCDIRSKAAGYLTSIDALKLGKAVMSLGAGRLKKDDEIDYTVGVRIKKKINEYVNVGDTLLTVYTNKEIADPSIFEVFQFSDVQGEEPAIIYDIIN